MLNSSKTSAPPIVKEVFYSLSGCGYSDKPFKGAVKAYVTSGDNDIIINMCDGQIGRYKSSNVVLGYNSDDSLTLHQLDNCGGSVTIIAHPKVAKEYNSNEKFYGVKIIPSSEVDRCWYCGSTEDRLTGCHDGRSWCTFS